MKNGGTKNGAAIAVLLALSSCVSIGEEPPPSLLTLTAVRTAPAGLAASGKLDQAISVLEPEAPRRLDAVRVPVQTSDSTLAYLVDAVWVEKPARLFAALLAETIRAKQTRLVVDSADMRHSAATRLSGQLLEMGYDAPSGSVVVGFDAVLQQADGTLLTRRFEARVDGVAADAASVGPALNDAANQVAVQVADWVG
jgi:cholesterol transport system auxiliary component